MKKKPINSSSFYEFLAPAQVAKTTTFKTATCTCGRDYKQQDQEAFCSYQCAKVRETANHIAWVRDRVEYYDMIEGEDY